MYRTIAHFIRKSTQLNASFINNQISNHINYKPVIIYRYESKKNDGGFAEFRLKDIPILNLSEGKRIDINFRYLKRISPADARKIIAFLKEINANILHFHYGSDAYIYADVIKYSGLPAVISFYGYDASSHKDFIFGYGGYRMKNLLFPYITKVLAMSPDMKEDIIKAGCPEDKIIVHYYGTDVRLFSDIRRDYIKKDKIILLILASLVPQKGHLFLLKSIKQLKEKGVRNVLLRIVGTGELERNLRNFVRKNKLGDVVFFVGAVKYGSNEMFDEFKIADIFIHPSVVAPNGDKEGIPGTIIEAMASGLPVISTYHAGIPFIIENGKTGLLVKEWDIDRLVNAILDMSFKEKRRKEIGLAGQKYAIDNLNILQKEKELEKIYNDLLTK